MNRMTSKPTTIIAAAARPSATVGAVTDGINHFIDSHITITFLNLLYNYKTKSYHLKKRFTSKIVPLIVNSNGGLFMTALNNQFLLLEQQLMYYKKEDFINLLSEDFLEYGSSGGIMDKPFLLNEVTD